MVRIGASPTPAAAASALPKVSFTKVEDDAFSGVGSVADTQARSYGCTDVVVDCSRLLKANE